MASEGDLYAMDLKGFWMDVGQPKDYLLGMNMYLNSVKNTDLVSKGPNITGIIYIYFCILKYKI